jgi:carbonic anhydrase
MLDETSKNSVKRTIDDILKRSPVIEELVKKNQVKIVGAYYNLENGKVTFFD